MNPLSAVLFWLLYVAAAVAAVGLWHLFRTGYRAVQAEKSNPLRIWERTYERMQGRQ